ncbi:hypothetical protein EDB84DRAFT_1676711 [Lactarius hengduanensis]|nr:hypothetical protein EDB84DRAFT_1676711 [Lactarius hengduanensis]
MRVSALFGSLAVVAFASVASAPSALKLRENISQLGQSRSRSARPRHPTTHRPLVLASPSSSSTSPRSAIRSTRVWAIWAEYYGDAIIDPTSQPEGLKRFIATVSPQTPGHRCLHAALCSRPILHLRISQEKGRIKSENTNKSQNSSRVNLVLHPIVHKLRVPAMKIQANQWVCLCTNEERSPCGAPVPGEGYGARTEDQTTLNGSRFWVYLSLRSAVEGMYTSVIINNEERAKAPSPSRSIERVSVAEAGSRAQISDGDGRDPHHDPIVKGYFQLTQRSVQPPAGPSAGAAASMPQSSSRRSSVTTTTVRPEGK